MTSVLELLVQGVAEGAKQKAEPMDPKQQVAELREFFAAHATTHKFTPGQIMRHKTPGTATIKWADHPHMFLEYLEDPIQAVGFAGLDDLCSAQATPIYDCKVAVRTGNCVATFFSDSRMWEPHPDFTETAMN